MGQFILHARIEGVGPPSNNRLAARLGTGQPADVIQLTRNFHLVAGVCLMSLASVAVRADLPAGTLVFHRVVIHDEQGTGLDAYTLNIPAGWQCQNRVIWDLQRTVAPTDLYVQVVNPAGSEEFTYFPSGVFVWSRAYQQYSAQMGGRVQGCPIRQPANGPLAAIKYVIIPAYLKGLGNYSVVSSKELPQMAAAYAPTYNKPGQPQGEVRAGTMRIEYQQGDRTMQQDIYCVFVIVSGPAGYVWALDHIVSFKAQKGALDQSGKKFSLMAASLLPTPKFMDAIDRVTNMLIQQFYQNQQALMQRVAIEEKAQQQISDQIMSGWEARSAAQTTAIDNYDAGAIRGVNNEVDPHTGDTVQVPDEATHAWSSSSGEIIYSDNENFKPGDYKNADWEELTPKH
ncbi:MAG TPA: hypothetical protein VNV15_00515 [Opitutaceae bacterium]|jgi:hypothetical protein|nr:hypothetical protein [Opitutaceae bacterium]